MITKFILNCALLYKACTQINFAQRNITPGSVLFAKTKPNSSHRKKSGLAHLIIYQMLKPKKVSQQLWSCRNGLIK